MRFLESALDENEVVDKSAEDEQILVDQITAPDKLPYHLLDVTKGRKTVRKFKSVRLSEVDRACQREYILGNCLDLSYTDYARFANLWQMDMGSVLHWFVQNNPKCFGNRVVGWWQCRACGYTRRFGVKPEEPCEQCNAHPRVTEYKEYMFRLVSPYHVVGKVDLILRVHPGTYRFAEVKTCSEDKKSPDGEHISQIASYTYFSKFDADNLPINIDRSTSYLVYFNKKFVWGGPVKIFTVKPTEALMNPIVEKISAITDGINSRTLVPPLTKCLTSKWKKGKAKSCGVANECQKYFEQGVVQL
jgi:hypothetical protein